MTTRPAARWVLAYLVVVVVDVTAELAGWGPATLIGPVLGMPLLIAVLVSSGLRRRLPRARWVLAALVFSWCGDVLGWVLPIKLGFFLIAQICYVVAFWPWRRGLRWPALVIVPYVLVVVAVIVAIRPWAGALLGPLVLYAVVLATMAVLAAGVHPVAGLGGAIFVVSDALIGLSVFRPDVVLPGGDAAIMATYFAAQGLLLLGVARAAAGRWPATAGGRTVGL